MTTSDFKSIHNFYGIKDTFTTRLVPESHFLKHFFLWSSLYAIEQNQVFVVINFIIYFQMLQLNHIKQNHLNWNVGKLSWTFAVLLISIKWYNNCNFPLQFCSNFPVALFKLFTAGSLFGSCTQVIMEYLHTIPNVSIIFFAEDWVHVRTYFKCSYRSGLNSGVLQSVVFHEYWICISKQLNLRDFDFGCPTSSGVKQTSMLHVQYYMNEFDTF